MPSAPLPADLPLTLNPDTGGTATYGVGLYGINTYGSGIYVDTHIPEIIPDTALTVVVTDAAGNTKTLDSHARDPLDRPMGITFGSQQGSGFYTGSFTLSNPIDRERDDVHLRDKVQMIGTNGEVAYEGFITDLPRSTDTDGQGTLTVQLAGYMADAGRQTFRMPFIDRDLSAWGEVSIQRRVNLIGAGWNPDGGSTTVAPDATGHPGIISARPGVFNKPVNEVVYDAGTGAKVSRLYVGTQTLSGIGTTDAFMQVLVATSDDDKTFTTVSADLKASTTIDQSLTAGRYVLLDWRYNSTAGGVQGTDYSVRWQNVRVVGNHGLSTNDVSGVPQGVTASDVIRYLIDTYCPKLNTAGVQDTTYPIAHLAFKERTKVYDALLKVNSFHLWQLAVWESGSDGRATVHFGPVDMTTWDWEIRHDEVGNQIALQGDSVEQLRNGIIVSFTNVATGATEELHPDDYAELRDDSVDNPFNMHGDKEYGEPFSIPFPTTQANALELGRLRLLEDNQVKAPGSFTVGPWVRDRAGQLQPVSMIRAGQNIRLVSSASLSDRPRLIHEVSYSHDGRSATVAVDSTLRYLEAYVDRTLSALAAANLQT